ncbi:helix-turn-helix domain-containing protein [bacterium]|nr:helix-turn-helix domain-containing protein [bacterium]
MRHTEITIKQGKETTKFKLPIEAGRGLLNFLRGLQEKIANTEDTESAPASDFFPDLKDPAKRIGIIFRGIRSKNNLTQAEVAERLNIDQSDVSKIEKGKRAIGKSLAKKIEKEFGIDYRRFL